MTAEPQSEAEKTALQSFLYPDASELSNSEMPIWDHLDELRERLLIAALAAGGAILTCFCFSKDLVVFLEAPVAEQGVRFLQLSPGEFFFTTFKVCTAAALKVLSLPAPLSLQEAYIVPHTLSYAFHGCNAMCRLQDMQACCWPLQLCFMRLWRGCFRA